MKKKSKKQKDTSFKSITPKHLKQLAGGRSYERGVDYYESDQVVSVGIDGNMVTASVEGRRMYKVHLWVDINGLDGRCTCPAFAELGFCKHCVAVGLAIIDSVKDSIPSKASPGADRSKVITNAVIMDDLRASLKKLDKGSIIEIIIEQAMDDDRFRERLKIKIVRRDSDGKIDLEWLKEIIDRAASISCYDDYNSLYDHIRDINQAIDYIEELLKRNYPEEVIELSEYTINALEKLINEVYEIEDDMDDVLERLLDLHLAGCKKVKPDPEQLAHRLFEWEKRFELDIFYDFVETYNRVLGKKGLKIYRELSKE